VDFRAQLAAIKSGQLRIDSAKLRDMQVRVFGDAAIVVAGGGGDGHLQGQALRRRVQGHRLLREARRPLQVVYSQMTSIKE